MKAVAVTVVAVAKAAVTVAVVAKAAVAATAVAVVTARLRRRFFTNLTLEDVATNFTVRYVIE